SAGLPRSAWPGTSAPRWRRIPGRPGRTVPAWCPPGATGARSRRRAARRQGWSLRGDGACRSPGGAWWMTDTGSFPVSVGAYIFPRGVAQACQRSLTGLGPLPVVREHAGEPPVLLFDLLDDHVGVFGLLAQHPDQGLGDVPDELGLLFAGRALGDLQVDVRHAQAPAIGSTAASRRVELADRARRARLPRPHCGARLPSTRTSRGQSVSWGS